MKCRENVEGNVLEKPMGFEARLEIPLPHATLPKYLYVGCFHTERQAYAAIERWKAGKPDLEVGEEGRVY